MALLTIPELNTRLGTLRAYLILSACARIALWLLTEVHLIFPLAYDSGVAGGIMSYKSFKKDSC